ncbi:YHS domain-containing (seleno)protein [Flagellimonas sp. 2504JD1-5]
MKRKTIKIIGITLAVLLGLIFTFAKIKRISPLSWGHKEVNQPLFSDTAINGYDPVAYIVSDKAMEGNEEYSYHWKNATWLFASEENQKLFMESPDKYTPEYGGYCAFAVSKGFTANSSPNAFDIIDGKLYLFDSEEVKQEWKSDLQENLKKGKANWE